MSTYTITVNDPNALPDEEFSISGVGAFINGQPKVVELTEEQANAAFGVMDEDGNVQIVSTDRVTVKAGGSLPKEGVPVQPETPQTPTGGGE